MVHTMRRVQDDRAIARKGARRRSYEAAFKRHLVELSLVPGASVAKIALDHRLNANILFKWRRHHLRELRTLGAQAGGRVAAGHRDRAAAAGSGSARTDLEFDLTTWDASSSVSAQ